MNYCTKLRRLLRWYDMRYTLWVLQAQSQHVPVTANFVKGMPEFLLAWKNCDLNPLKNLHIHLSVNKRGLNRVCIISGSINTNLILYTHTLTVITYCYYWLFKKIKLRFDMLWAFNCKINESSIHNSLLQPWNHKTSLFLTCTNLELQIKKVIMLN